MTTFAELKKKSKAEVKEFGRQYDKHVTAWLNCQHEQRFCAPKPLNETSKRLHNNPSDHVRESFGATGVYALSPEELREIFELDGRKLRYRDTGATFECCSVVRKNEVIRAYKNGKWPASTKGSWVQP